MHEVLAHQRLVRPLRLRVLGADQAQPDQLGLHQLDHRLLIFQLAVAGAEDLVGPAEDPQHRVVNLPLAGGETAVHRDRPGQVGGPAGVFRGDVQQQHLAVLADAVVVEVVQDAGVLAAADDRVVGEAARAAADELVGQLGLDLPFADARLDEAQQAPEPGLRNVAGPLDDGELDRVLDHPQAVHQGREALVAVQRIAGLALLDEAVVGGLHHRRGAQVLVGRQIDVVGLRDQPVDPRFEAVRPFDPLDPGCFARLLLVELFTVPDRDVLAGLLDEEDFPLLGVRGIGHQHQHGLLLVDAGEVEEVGVLLERHRPVGVGRVDVVGQHDGDAVRLEQGAEFLAVADEQLGVDGVVAHGRSPADAPAARNGI